MLLVTAAEMRALDRETIDVLGVPGVVLMESAGRGVVDVMAAHAELAKARVVAFCGTGNNGGDGFVVARHLHARGAEVTIALVGERDKIAGDARIHFVAAEKSGVKIVDAPAALLHRNDLVVDALFGTGLSRPIEAGGARDAIARMRAHRGPVFAVDVPSGLDADRGVIGPSVRADHTITFAFAKLGLVGAGALAVVGQLHVHDIGISERLARARGVKAELLGARILDPLRVREAGGHKGTHGHVLVVAGSRGKTGAALLCGSAVLRSGAGLCTLAMSSDAADVIEGRIPELMIERLDGESRKKSDGESRKKSGDDKSELAALMENKTAAAIGPGIGRDDVAKARLRELGASELPLVVDADALTLLAAQPSLLPKRAAATVLTPHPGEASRLLGRDTEAIQADRVGSARAIAEHYGAICVLKGERTIICAPDGRLAINPTGNPGMGTGGTGDVLTGVVAAALARTSGKHADARTDAFAAACAAVYLHGAAGDRAAAERSQTGLLAGDVVDALPHLLGGR